MTSFEVNLEIKWIKLKIYAQHIREMLIYECQLSANVVKILENLPETTKYYFIHS